MRLPAIPSISTCFLIAFPVLSAPEPTAPVDERFKVEVLATNLSLPMELEMARDGRIFFNEFDGPLRILNPQTGSIVEAGRLSVFNELENGFLGFALDPGFESNQWIYLYYSPTNFSGQRLSRFAMNKDHLEMTSERVLLEFFEQRRECCHHAGSVEFGPDGNLFVSTGDNTHPFGDSGSYAPIDGRPDREPWDAQDGPANTADLRGKILRIRPTLEGGYTIPDGNLFPKDGSGGRPEIFVMGCRNPWRMSVDQSTGFVYWGDVGPDAGGDGPPGSRGYDEINQARAAGNFGWPYFVGNNFPYADRDFATGKIGPLFDPAHPINNSPRNTGAKALPPAQPALIYWPYGRSAEFPMLGEGGRTACAGPVFHFKPGFRDTGGFPQHFDNCLLFYDWQRPFIKWARLDSDSRLHGIEPFIQTIALTSNADQVRTAREAGRFVIQRPVDSVFGPDGCLYLLDYGAGWGLNPDSRMIKISYQWGNLPPVAHAAADILSGRAPLTVHLSSRGSNDPDGQNLRYDWRLHPGNTPLASQPDTTLTVNQPGNYVVELIVSDPEGATHSATLPLIVGNTIPELRFVQPNDGDFFTPGRVIPYEIVVTDAEDGSSKNYEEIFESRTYVSVLWTQAGAQTPDPPGLALMKQSDCFNCHARDTKIVGPPLIEIANRYRGQPDAIAASTERVLKGSAGVWSDLPMLPHTSLSPDEARKMVHWIYALEHGDDDNGLLRGLIGSITPPKAEAIQVAILEASYTDDGNPPAGVLTGKTFLQLRNRRVEAEQADALEGPQLLDHFLGAIHDGHYARFDGLNLAGTGSVTLRVASGGPGGLVELRRGSPSGITLARTRVEPTGSWNTWVEINSPLNASAGRDPLYVVFTNPGDSHLMNLDWVQFNAE